MTNYPAPQFTLSFEGGEAEKHLIDFYDVTKALSGFQRSLALTTHLILNGEIITQAPSLKGAQIYAIPPEPGSWKTTAVIVGIGLYNLGTLENNSPLGHIVYSLYDYVISESIGVHVDYDKSLGQLYEDAKRRNPELKPVTQNQADSLIEKCSTAVREMHRPIFKNQTATNASITYALPGGEEKPLNSELNVDSYEFLFETHTSATPEEFLGRVSSYNSNTFKGRIFIPEFGRPVVFELAKTARAQTAIKLITASLGANAIKSHKEPASTIKITAFRNTSRSGHLKSLNIVHVG